MLILPDDPLFYPTLYGTMPPSSQPENYIVRAGELVAVPASPTELREYLEGGEYDEVADLEDWDDG